jgi:large subunit ribosomal protein L3
MATKAIVGEKVGMTQVWDADNRIIPVTVLRVSPARIVQIKTTERDGYAAVQVTYGRKDARKLTKPEAGHFAKAGVEPGTNLVELRLDDIDGFTVGQEISADVLAKGERVDATALSRGKGWTGAMKRHNFTGQGASHGNHKMHRSPGSIGACSFPGRVFKGTKMAGRSGGQQVTTLNLEIVEADAERNLVLVKGAIPGPRGGVVILRNAVKGPEQPSARTKDGAQ